MSVVKLETVRRPVDAPPYELHLATEAARVHLDDGTGDTDLVMAIAVCRERGRILAGPLGNEVFGRVPRHMLLRAFAEEIPWGLEHAPPEYAVLNACRSWRFLKQGELCSKVEGGEWARDRVENGSLVEAALAGQRGDPAALDAAEARTFAEAVRDRLLEAAEEG